MNIPFVKMQGAGNDYIYLDLVKEEIELDFASLAADISDRHFGVGGDGLVLIMRSGEADFRMRMFNADGSEAEMCGNAVRCVGKYVYDSGYTSSDTISVQTLAGIKHLTVVQKGDDAYMRDAHMHGASMLTVDMGEPVLDGKSIPVNVDENPVLDLEVEGFTGTAVSMGNPHFVIFVDRVTDDLVLNHGPRIEVAPVFPRKVNVEFVQVLDSGSTVLRVWERGSGETLACGTGACASVVAGVLNGLHSREVSVSLLGGVLRIAWNEKNNRVYLTGPAVEVFRGTFNVPRSCSCRPFSPGRANHPPAS